MFRTIFYLFIFILFTLIIFFGYLVIWVLTVAFDRNRAISHHYSRFWSKMIFKLNPWWKVEVEGLENIDKNKSYLVLSNHQAMLDIPLLYVLPFNFKWVSKKEVYRIPVFGWVLWMHGDIAIERGGAASAKRMMNQCSNMLKRGVSIIMFPEGTRTKDGQVRNFQAGAFLLAKKTKVDILPVVIDGTYDAFRGGKDGKFGISARHIFKVKILKPLPVEEVISMKFTEINDLMQNTIQQEHRIIAPNRYKNQP